MMRHDTYLAGQLERALHADPRTHRLGIRVEVTDDDVVLHGQVASDERRRLVAQVADEQAPLLTVRNEVSVTEVLPPEVPEVIPLPEEIVPSREVPPPHQASS
ncbi:MAG TPA: BON domain-containing protein [Trebonia sp.]